MKISVALAFVINLFLIIILISSSLAYIFLVPYTYSSKIYSIQADTVIRDLCINGHEIAAHYQIFQVEEDYKLQWQLETPVRRATTTNTLFTYSSLQTYDCEKTFIFRPNGFTVEISKLYKVTGFCDNNQIIVDVNNSGFTYNNTSFTFFGKGWNMTIDILSSNTPITIQPPPDGYKSELQFDFNNMTDRDIAFHAAGDIETALFNVTLNNV